MNSHRQLRYFCFLSLFSSVFLLSSCREEVVVYAVEQEPCGEPKQNGIAGFYLLNEGNMGSNKSTIDYYDYTTGIYNRNIYSAHNPTVTKELGDVGNDLRVYGNRLYAVVNVSNKVEVMDARTLRRIGQVDIPNCRNICFNGAYAYVTSYAGPVVINPDYEQKGYVARFDTATLQIQDRCIVGFQPDGIEVADGKKLYVANSGGYMVPNYENTLSVIDLATFTEIKRIPVAVNLQYTKLDQYGQLWVNNRGNYYDIPSKLYCIDTHTDQLLDSINMAVSNFTIVGDSLYFYGSEWSYILMEEKVSYGIVDVHSRQLLTDRFITDGTESRIEKPYGIAVNAKTYEILLTDAKDYVTPGMLYCFSPSGTCLWSVRTGDIPAHFAFLVR